MLKKKRDALLRKGVGTLFLFVPSMVFANGSGGWIGVNPIIRIGSKTRVELQSEYRRQGGQSLTLIRPSFHYFLSENIEGGSGFDLFSSKIFESRIWQEFKYHKAFSEGKAFAVRVRQEVRRGAEKSATSFRSRFMIDYQTFPSSWSVLLHLYDEVFLFHVNFNNEYSNFDRNWLGVRLGIKSGQNILNLGAFLESVKGYGSGVVGTLSFQFHPKFE